MNVVLRKASTNTRMSELASEALQARLYVSGWMLNAELNDIKNSRDMDEYITSITIAYLDGKPIGVCTSRRWRRYKNPIVMVFVRKKYRRLGIGTKMVKKIMGKKPGFKYGSGVNQKARKFFSQFKSAVDSG